MNKLEIKMTPKIHKRIFSKISINPNTKCWEWTGSLDQCGYGMTGYKGKTERIHRVMYSFFIEPIPTGGKYIKKYQIDHLCRNHKCCNPEHLELVTCQTNVLRGNGIASINSQKEFCKFGHKLPPHKTNGRRRFCKICDSIRHKRRMEGPNREYWLKKAREASQRQRDKKK